MAFSVKQYLEEERDEALLHWLWKALLAFILAATLLGRIPYGRYRDEKGFVSWLILSWVRLPARLGWFVMEFPSLAVPLYLLFGVRGRYVGGFNPNTVLLSMFIIHYINRTLVYSLTLRSKSTPLAPMLTGMCVCAINGFLQGRYLTNYTYYDMSWFYDPRFSVGLILFLAGLAINVHSDSILRGLRKPWETGYKIPHAGMFRYVSGANYFGESLEWTGYAIACWSMFGGFLAVWTTIFLGSRALQHHKFYQMKFEDYPKERRAFIPFVL